MNKIQITIIESDAGVRVDVSGNLDNRTSDASFVARGMVIYAAALFVGGRQVTLSGSANTQQMPELATLGGSRPALRPSV